jgi:hypothetical protein
MFQTSTVNGGTDVALIPNGTALQTVFRAFNTLDPTNSSCAVLLANATEASVRSTVTGTGSFLPLTFWNGGSERVRINTSGNVGIGTISPTDVLDVNGTFRVRGNRIFQDNSGGNAFEIGPSAGTGDSTVWGFVAPAARSIAWSTNATERMRLDSSGNVGIGTTSPRDPGAGFKGITLNGSTSGYFDLNTNGTRIFTLFGSGNDILLTNPTATGSMQFYTNNTERARIDSSGRLLLGTTATSGGTLTVHAIGAISTGSINTYAITCGNDAGDALAFGSDANFAYAQSFGGRPLILNQQGNEVRVCGTADNGAFNLQCNFTGVWGAGAYVNGSDERIKDDITPIASGLDVVTKLNPVTYRYKEDWSKDQSTQTGFIAQELLTALDGQVYVDGVVQQGGSEGYYSVAYQNIIPILTKAIQEQQQMIDELKAKVAALENA